MLFAMVPLPFRVPWLCCYGADIWGRRAVGLRFKDVDWRAEEITVRGREAGSTPAAPPRCVLPS
ncbi:MAG: hypothetical protein J2O47_10030 [Acidimicrobiaceae bacterium]|nr:hypothetical protein [Acidimicrobiaceae bacterium]